MKLNKGALAIVASLALLLAGTGMHPALASSGITPHAATCSTYSAKPLKTLSSTIIDGGVSFPFTVTLQGGYDSHTPSIFCEVLRSYVTLTVPGSARDAHIQ